MQKKLIAVAVASVLGAPAVALAQTSTVNIYGNITYEYGIADQGTGRPNVDYADTPGGSAIGFRGEEKLGGGMSAWFQCETSADVRGFDQVGLCSRNSAVGFKGGFGNIFFGRWDTPLKRALNQGGGYNETGILGMSFLAYGGSGGSSAQYQQVNAINTESANPAGETNQRQRFKRRETAMSYYESPVFSGFQVLAGFSAATATADTPAFDAVGTSPGSTNQKPRVWSIGGTYSAGPLAIGVGYEVHDDMGDTRAVTDAKDKGWGASAAYTFGGNVKVGLTYLRREWEIAALTGPPVTTDVKTDTWNLQLDWNISGPHGLEASYTWAGDCKGNTRGSGANNTVAGLTGNGGCNAPIKSNGLANSDTGAQAFGIMYTYAFSKRTKVKFGYSVQDNEDNSNRVRIGNTASLTGSPNALGQKLDGFAFHIGHRF
jgi:predicted porin